MLELEKNETGKQVVGSAAEGQAQRRFQRLIYPEGVPVLDGEVGTPVTHCVFNNLRAVSGVQSYKVAPTVTFSNLNRRSTCCGWDMSHERDRAITGCLHPQC